MSTNTDGVSAMSAELGALPEPVATIANDGHPRHIGHVWGIGEARLYGPPRNLYREDQLKAYAAAAVAAERKRWQQVAKAVIESHDAALTYVYERLRSQGVGSITIPDSAVAEIKAVNALRELVQPNTEAQRTAAGGPTGAQSWAADERKP